MRSFSWKITFDVAVAGSPRMLRHKSHKSSSPLRYIKKLKMCLNARTQLVPEKLPPSSPWSFCSRALLPAPCSSTGGAESAWLPKTAHEVGSCRDTTSATLSGCTTALSRNGIARSSTTQHLSEVSRLVEARKNGRSGWEASPYTSAWCSVATYRQVAVATSQTRMVESQDPLKRMFGRSWCHRTGRTKEVCPRKHRISVSPSHTRTVRSSLPLASTFGTRGCHATLKILSLWPSSRVGVCSEQLPIFCRLNILTTPSSHPVASFWLSVGHHDTPVASLGCLNLSSTSPVVESTTNTHPPVLPAELHPPPMAIQREFCWLHCTRYNGRDPFVTC
mmetsp:Transcript_514/g.1011  ORF Transcript_514/g.1011 Transcript_514/m.1011 type:complete len:334 (-) Transcript_514:880-1881(-)